MELKEDKTFMDQKVSSSSEHAAKQDPLENQMHGFAAPKRNFCQFKQQQQQLSQNAEYDQYLNEQDNSFLSETVDDVDTRGDEILLQHQVPKQKNKRDQKTESKQNRVLADNYENINDGDDSQLEQEDSNIVNICGHIIDIEKITKQEIFKMRKILPKQEYRQLKNRKSARECRKKRKEERSGMMDELMELRNDKIKLKAEVEVLTKQLQRLEENERKAQKHEPMPAATSTSTHVVQIQNASNCYLNTCKNTVLNTEKSIQAKIDQALSSKFESFFGMFELKVTDLIQNEMKKLLSQSGESKSQSDFEEEIKQQNIFDNIQSVKKCMDSPEINSVSCQLYQGRGSNDFENNQTQHDSNAASVYNLDGQDHGNLLLGQFNQANQNKANAQNPQLMDQLRNLLLTNFNKFQQTSMLKGTEQVKQNGQKAPFLAAQAANPIKKQKISVNIQNQPQNQQSQKMVDELLVRLKRMHDQGQVPNLPASKLMSVTNGYDGSISPVSSVPSSSKDFNLGKFVNKPSAGNISRPDSHQRNGQISKIGPGVGHGGRR